MSTAPPPIAEALAAIRRHALETGGFSLRKGEGFRPDATAWSILALNAAGQENDLLEAARRRLADSQLPDGRVPMAPHLPEAYWPTTLAVLAWGDTPPWRAARNRAADFLLTTGGFTLPFDGDTTQGHDSTIRGWTWIEGSYSWIVPSAMAVMALSRCGRGDHRRVKEAVRLMVDRQLTDGGWNYGDTYAFGTALLPVPEATGHALVALHGAVPAQTVRPSLDYLAGALPGLRSPLSLSWTILALASWGRETAGAETLIMESLALQRRYGTYDSDLVAQLVLAYFQRASTGGIL